MSIKSNTNAPTPLNEHEETTALNIALYFPDQTIKTLYSTDMPWGTAVRKYYKDHKVLLQRIERLLTTVGRINYAGKKFDYTVPKDLLGDLTDATAIECNSIVSSDDPSNLLLSKDVTIVKLGLSAGIAPGRNDSEALIKAVKDDNYDVVELLLETVEIHNEEPLYTAVCKGKCNMVQLLLKHRSVGSKAMRSKSIHAAITKGHYDIFQHLYRNYIENCGSTEDESVISDHTWMLETACSGYDVRIVKFLLSEFKAPGGDALAMAVKGRHIDIVRLVVAHPVFKDDMKLLTDARKALHENDIDDPLGMLIHDAIKSVEERQSSVYKDGCCGTKDKQQNCVCPKHRDTHALRGSEGKPGSNCNVTAPSTGTPYRGSYSRTPSVVNVPKNIQSDVIPTTVKVPEVIPVEKAETSFVKILESSFVVVCSYCDALMPDGNHWVSCYGDPGQLTRKKRTAAKLECDTCHISWQVADSGRCCRCYSVPPLYTSGDSVVCGTCNIIIGDDLRCNNCVSLKYKAKSK